MGSCSVSTFVYVLFCSVAMFAHGCPALCPAPDSTSEPGLDPCRRDLLWLRRQYNRRHQGCK